MICHEQTETALEHIGGLCGQSTQPRNSPHVHQSFLLISATSPGQSPCRCTTPHRKRKRGNQPQRGDTNMQKTNSLAQRVHGAAAHADATPTPVPFPKARSPKLGVSSVTG